LHDVASNCGRLIEIVWARSERGTAGFVDARHEHSCTVLVTSFNGRVGYLLHLTELDAAQSDGVSM
jgi:hypothetical protein